MLILHLPCLSITGEIVKERFINLILPLATKLTKGTSVDNIRARINDALSRLPKQRPK